MGIKRDSEVVSGVASFQDPAQTDKMVNTNIGSEGMVSKGSKNSVKSIVIAVTKQHQARTQTQSNARNSRKTVDK